MKRHLAYLRYVLRHKYYVWRASQLIGGIPFWRILFHDWDKFMPDEWFPYAYTFYWPDGRNRYWETPSFNMAWNRHQKRNRHHWQWWLITWDRGKTEALPMEEADLREMVADWVGAGWVITGNPDPSEWYAINRDNIILHEETRKELEALLNMVTRRMSWIYIGE